MDRHIIASTECLGMDGCGIVYMIYMDWVMFVRVSKCYNMLYLFQSHGPMGDLKDGPIAYWLMPGFISTDGHHGLVVSTNTQLRNSTFHLH